MARPVVKWAGGKRGLISELERHIPKRQFARYVEPFAGGAALFFYLASEKAGERCFREAILCDQNADLVALYRTIKSKEKLPKLKNLLKARQSEYDDLDEKGRGKLYYRVRGEKHENPVLRAARMLFLNKTCFNGLWRVNASGAFNVPFGRYTKPKIFDSEALDQAHEALQCARIEQGDYRKATTDLGGDDLVYFDPPYAPVSKTANFTAYAKGGFGPREQAALGAHFADLAANGVTCILSNAWEKDIRDLYDRFERHRVPVPRAINSVGAKRGAVDELIVSYDPLATRRAQTGS